MKKGKIIITADRCKGCLLCIEGCPKGEIEPGVKINKYGYNVVDFKNKGLCNACTLCAIVCPDAAIEVYEILEGTVKPK